MVLNNDIADIAENLTLEIGQDDLKAIKIFNTFSNYDYANKNALYAGSLRIKNVIFLIRENLHFTRGA